jgi:hypothetical protein
VPAHIDSADTASDENLAKLGNVDKCEVVAVSRVLLDSRD